MDKSRMIFFGGAIIIEIAAILILVKAISTDSSPAQGLMFLAIGLLFLIIGITRKSKDSKKETQSGQS